jgi:hypothetical protein
MDEWRSTDELLEIADAIDLEPILAWFEASL